MIKAKKEKNKKNRQVNDVEPICVSSPDGREKVCSSSGGVVSISARKTPDAESGGRGNVFIDTLNIFSAPFRSLREGYERKYARVKKFFIIDLVLLMIVGVLTGLNIYLYASRAGNISFGPLAGWSWGEGEISGETVLDESENNFLVNIKINGQEEINVTPGEDLNYEIIYKNADKGSIYDVALKINLESAVLDLENANLGGGILRDGAIIWTKDQISDFVELPSGAGGKLNIKIITDKTATPERVLKFGSDFKSWLDISYKIDSNFGKSVRFSSSPIVGKINSDLIVKALARYYTAEGDQLGMGPLPPRVGETTKYWVFWSLENNLNEVSDVTVSAILPPEVSWTGNVSVILGELSYSEARHAVTWKVGDIESYSGENLPNRGAAFEIGLAPTADQLGEKPTLLQKIKISGTDKFTGLFLERGVPDLTTDLLYDKFNKSEGVVIR